MILFENVVKSFSIIDKIWTLSLQLCGLFSFVNFCPTFLASSLRQLFPSMFSVHPLLVFSIPTPSSGLLPTQNLLSRTSFCLSNKEILSLYIINSFKSLFYFIVAFMIVKLTLMVKIKRVGNFHPKQDRTSNFIFSDVSLKVMTYGLSMAIVSHQHLLTRWLLSSIRLAILLRLSLRVRRLLTSHTYIFNLYDILFFISHCLEIEIILRISGSLLLKKKLLGFLSYIINIEMYIIVVTLIMC